MCVVPGKNRKRKDYKSNQEVQRHLAKLLALGRGYILRALDRLILSTEGNCAKKWRTKKKKVGCIEDLWSTKN